MMAVRLCGYRGVSHFVWLRYTLPTMPEFPDANSGGLDPGGAPTAKCKAPLGKRVRAWSIIVTLYATFLGMAVGAVWLLRSVFDPGVAMDDRLMHLLWAGSLLAPLGFVVRYFVRIRLKTGRWRGTPEQRKQDREQRLAKCGVDGTRRGTCGVKRDSPIKYAIKWASCAAFQPTYAGWQRSAAWIVLAAYTLAVLAVAAFGVICFGAAFDHNTVTATLFMIAMGLVVAVWPAMVAWRLIRGIRNGRVGTTREELDELRAQRAAWAMREQQEPLRSKLISTAIGLAVYALWWIRVTVHHAQHPRESWVTPAMGTPFILYSIWVQFRPAKNAPPQATDN